MKKKKNTKLDVLKIFSPIILGLIIVIILITILSKFIIK